ncbi:MAG: NAD(P)H-hydrate dehydratase [Cocleimonas sp.]
MSLPDTLYTAEQVKNIEQFAINECGITSYTLMQDAGQFAFDQIRERYPDCKSICVICGTGNNGGDGYIVARLALQSKLKVTLIQMGKADSIEGDALLAKQEYVNSGGVSSGFNTLLLDTELLNTELIVDAIFGTGLDRNISGDYLTAIEAINNKTKVQLITKIIAIDIPSGLGADSGAIFGNCVTADLTVTFVGLKRGLFTGQAKNHVGKIAFNALSIPTEAYQQLEPSRPINIIPDNILKQYLKPRLKCSHKGHFGHVLLIGSDEGMTGAIRLAAEAALRCGAGLVSVATHPSHATTLNLGRPEIMVHGIAQAAALKPLLEKASVIVIGPGLGLSDWSKSLFAEAITSNLPTLIDADALNLLAEKNNTTKCKENWILTPHPKEMSRLLNKSTAEVEADRFNSNIECVTEKTLKSGGVSLLKGAGTIISDKHKTMVCTKGNPGMSSGGMGDVLSGVIAAMLAQGLSLFDAASVGVYLHATAADLAAKDGEKGLLASDLFPHLRALVNNQTL